MLGPCLIACLAAGCGGSPHPAGATATTATAAVAKLRLQQRSPRVVLVAAAGSARLVATATAHPAIHFALIGRSARPLHLPNVMGIVLRDDQAVRLGGAVAGLSAEESGRNARVAWVGPDEPLVAQFVRGVHEAAPGTVVLRAWSSTTPASCKEAALGAIDRGATIVMARGGVCADAAISGAHQQNLPGLRLSDFELPGVAVGQVLRDAAAGVYHGSEDVVFGARSGTVGVRTLDPLIAPAVSVRARAAAQELANGLRLTG